MYEDSNTVVSRVHTTKYWPLNLSCTFYCFVIARMICWSAISFPSIFLKISLKENIHSSFQFAYFLSCSSLYTYIHTYTYLGHSTLKWHRNTTTLCLFHSKDSTISYQALTDYGHCSNNKQFSCINHPINGNCYTGMLKTKYSDMKNKEGKQHYLQNKAFPQKQRTTVTKSVCQSSSPIVVV